MAMHTKMPFAKLNGKYELTDICVVLLCLGFSEAPQIQHKRGYDL
jgi:hypothetical protein